jgi:hypothetical protein
MFWIYLISLSICAVIISYQDFKTRLINVFVILLFGIINVAQYLLTDTIYQFLENTVFTFVYFLFSYLVIHLFYFIKTKQFQKMLNAKVGWGDVLLFFFIGICQDPAHLIFFFTISFVLAVIFHFVFFRTNKQVPLAGVLAINYILYLLVFKLEF